MARPKVGALLNRWWWQVSSAETQFIEVGHGAYCRRIATIVENRGDSTGPGIIWLPGFMSEMTSTKVSMLADWAERNVVSMARLDYTGHGKSPGRIEDCTIGGWLEEVRAVFSRTRGPQIVVGSSMGGYLALLLLRSLMTEAPREAKRTRALILIAPAWDMTARISKGLSNAARSDIEEKGVWYRPSRYGDGPYPVTRTLLEDGERHLIGATPLHIQQQIYILHGKQDPDVPFEHSLALVDHLDSANVQLIEIPDGDHRLSRPQDLALLVRTVELAMSQIG